MSIFSKLFRSPDQRRIDRIAEESRRKASRILAPLAALGQAIILTSQKCRDGVKPWIVASDQKGRRRMEMFVFYEFVYFFMHLTMRHAFIVMTDTEKKLLEKHLVRMVASVSVEGSWEHLPEDFRTRLIAEFCANLQAAEFQYATCAPGDIFSDSKAEEQRNFRALFMTLGDNVALSMGRKDDGEFKSETMTIAAEQFGKLNLLESLQNFKRDSMELSDLDR